VKNREKNHEIELDSSGLPVSKSFGLKHLLIQEITLKIQP
jgi:hypothetical protein